jgi:hypothetical protein
MCAHVCVCAWMRARRLRHGHSGEGDLYRKVINCQSRDKKSVSRRGRYQHVLRDECSALEAPLAQLASPLCHLNKANSRPPRRHQPPTQDDSGACHAACRAVAGNRSYGESGVVRLGARWRISMRADSTASKPGLRGRSAISSGWRQDGLTN